MIKGNLTEDEKLLVMDLHNKKRMLIANGLEKRGDPGPQPPAANMMELVIYRKIKYIFSVEKDFLHPFMIAFNFDFQVISDYL